VLGDPAAARVAVNRGGVLEAWARKNLAERELLTVDDNMSLPELLAQGRVGALVTDSFELRAFERPGWASRCEAPLTRKVYWVGPGRAGDLGPRIDRWQREHTAVIVAAQERWFGARQPLDASTHLVDLLARRFAFMPLVATLKAARGLPLEDLAREREVIAGARQSAARHGLPELAVGELFALQIELSKAVQRRQSEPSALDLGTQVRPALLDLGERIVQALGELRDAETQPALAPAALEPLGPWLTVDERLQLLARVNAVFATPHGSPAVVAP
jgi:chorismate mutase